MWSVISLCAVLSLLGALSGANAVVTGREFDRTCSSFNVSAVKPLKLKLLDGDWYLYATYDKGLPLHTFNCIKFTRHAGKNENGEHTMETKEVAQSITTDNHTLKQSILLFKDPKVGIYTYKIGNISQNTKIVATNYLNYYIEFHCVDSSGGKSNCYLGIFTRRTKPTNDALQTINKFLDDHKFQRKNLRMVKQGQGCDY